MSNAAFVRIAGLRMYMLYASRYIVLSVRPKKKKKTHIYIYIYIYINVFVSCYMAFCLT